VGVAPFYFVTIFGTFSFCYIFSIYYIGAMRQKADNKMKQIEAKEVIKTLNWIAQADEDGQSVLEPKRNRNGIYECLVRLPLIEKTVIGIGDHKLESIDNATKQTSKLIDEYLEENPDCEVKNMFGNSRYVLEEDDNECLYIHLMQEGACC
jgi:hypothetical protein